MASKKTTGSKKTVTTKAAPRPLDEKTGYRVGSLGYEIGRAYLSATKHEKAVEAVEEIIRSSAKAKGKSTAEEYVHGRAISWIGFLKVRDAKIYADLPKTEKASKSETVKA